MSKIICLDAGHGGRDSGAVNGLRYEKNDTLRLALAVEQELLYQGFGVIQTRTSDKDVSLYERSTLANTKKADLFISLHRNAFTSSSAIGIENWIYKGTNSQTIKFAQYILDEVVKVGAQANRGIKSGNFHVTRETNMPACLLELGFISNVQDNKLFDDLIEKYAASIAKAVCLFYGIPYKIKETPDNNTDDTFYRVQVGAFKNKANAIALTNELKSKGYSVIIV